MLKTTEERYFEHQNIYFVTGVYVKEDHSWTLTETSLIDSPLATFSGTNMNLDYQLLNQNTGSVELDIRTNTRPVQGTKATPTFNIIVL